jgi:hypothetical protein
MRVWVVVSQQAERKHRHKYQIDSLHRTMRKSNLGVSSVILLFVVLTCATIAVAYPGVSQLRGVREYEAHLLKVLGEQARNIRVLPSLEDDTLTTLAKRAFHAGEIVLSFGERGLTLSKALLHNDKRSTLYHALIEEDSRSLLSALTLFVVIEDQEERNAWWMSTCFSCVVV